MGAVTSSELELQAAQVREHLATALQQHGRLVTQTASAPRRWCLPTSSATHFPQIEMFSIDTGRLHEETYRSLEKLQHRYGNRIRVVTPDAAALERLVRARA